MPGSRRTAVYLLVLIAALLWGYKLLFVDESTPPLPEHDVVLDQPVWPRDGRGITVQVDYRATRWAGCKALVERYQGEVGPEGWVVVERPSGAEAGRVYRWCWLDKASGEPIQYADRSLYPGAK